MFEGQTFSSEEERSDKMAGGGSEGGISGWLPMGSLGLAGLVGAMFMSTGETPSPSNGTVATMVGSQNVPVQTNENRVIRMRAPIRDFLGLKPLDKTDEDGDETKKSDCCLLELLKEKPPKPNPEEAWKVDSELETNLKQYKLNFMIMTVADPIDSVENYLFDHQIDALLKGLAADKNDRWLYCSSYLPWQVFKDRRAIKNETPLLRQNHWYQDEPGVLVFRKSQEKDDKIPELLLVYLVGELPTLGIQRDAMDHSIHEIVRLTELGQPDNTREKRRRFTEQWVSALYDLNGPADATKPINQAPSYQSSIDVRIIGPCFTGGAFTLRESLRDAKRKYSIRPQIVTASATAIEPGYFEDDHFIGATVCSWVDTQAALETVINKRKCAWLVETGTGFSSRFERQGEESEFVFPLPAGISRVRSGFEKQISTARQQAKGLQPLSSTSPLPFDVDDVARDFPTIQTPLMTTSSAELVLNEIVRTIKDDGIMFVAIMFTDVRDTIFLGEFLKSHSPYLQLLISEPDILLAHPEYTDSLRGAIVASSYPMFPSGRDACQKGANTQVMPIMTGQAINGVYNAVLIHRAFDRGLLARDHSTAYFLRPETIEQSSFSLVGLFHSNGLLTPRTWLHVVGYDRFYPLKIILPEQSNITASIDTKKEAYSISIVMNGKESSGSFRLRTNLLPWYPVIALSALSTLLLIVCFLSLFSQLSWMQKKEYGGNEVFRPLFLYSSQSLIWRRVLLIIMMSAISVIVYHLSYLGQLLILGECVPQKISWITETYFFSGVSLFLPLILSGAAIVYMCYMKLRQSYLVSPERLKTIEGSKDLNGSQDNKLESLWWAWGSGGNDLNPIKWLSRISGVLVCLWCLRMTLSTTFETSENPCLFWSAWSGIAIGYAIWWIAAIELYLLQRRLRDFAETVNKFPDQNVWEYEFEKLHQKGLKGVYRLLFGAGPGNRDPVKDSITDNADCAEVCNALYFFRNIQYRMMIIKNQLYLLLGGALLLFMSVVSYPFTSGGMLNFVSMGTILTLVASACLCFWKLETDRDLSKILGTKQDAIEWNWGTISFFARNVLLVVLMLIIQFVPGTWLWLSRIIAPFSHFSH
jgi:hypothetical protein